MVRKNHKGQEAVKLDMNRKRRIKELRKLNRNMREWKNGTRDVEVEQEDEVAEVE